VLGTLGVEIDLGPVVDELAGAVERRGLEAVAIVAVAEVVSLAGCGRDPDRR
jgi:hypothetical protein